MNHRRGRRRRHHHHHHHPRHEGKRKRRRDQAGAVDSASVHGTTTISSGSSGSSRPIKIFPGDCYLLGYLLFEGFALLIRGGIKTGRRVGGFRLKFQWFSFFLVRQIDSFFRSGWLDLILTGWGSARVRFTTRLFPSRSVCIINDSKRGICAAAKLGFHALSPPRFCPSRRRTNRAHPAAGAAAGVIAARSRGVLGCARRFGSPGMVARFGSVRFAWFDLVLVCSDFGWKFREGSCSFQSPEIFNFFSHFFKLFGLLFGPCTGLVISASWTSLLVPLCHAVCWWGLYVNWFWFRCQLVDCDL